MQLFNNTVLLSRVYEQKQVAGDNDALATIQGVSPVAWQHVNLFSPSTSTIYMDAWVARYANPACWNKTLTESGEPQLS